MKESLDSFENTVDQVLSPDRIMRWIVRIVLLIVLIGVAVVVTKLAFHMTAKVETVTTDRDWFSTQLQVIEAAGAKERAAREALERHQADVKSRSGMFTLTKQSDLDETNRLNNEILSAQKERASLVADYNARLQKVTDPALKKSLEPISPEAKVRKP